MNKTKEQLIQYRDAIDAHLAGKPVQDSNDGVAWYQVIPGWTALYYRPAPEPKVIPWTRETCPPLRDIEIVGKVNGIRWTISCATINHAYVRNTAYLWSELLENFTFPDGSPCGQTV